MTASLLPNAEQTFIDANGIPLDGGSVYFYIPNTSTLKNTWKNAGQTILNTNPVILDSAGRAIIYGTGQYRQVVYDANSNLIWDALTTDLIGAIQNSVALFCGTSTGSANSQVVSPSPSVTAISTGQQFSFFAGYTNTSAMTLEISTITHTIKVGGSDTIAGNVVAGMATLVEFDGTNFQLINPQPEFSLPSPGASGNLLSSNGSSWISAMPLLPAPGTSGNLLTSNGAAWVSAVEIATGGNATQSSVRKSSNVYAAYTGSHVVPQDDTPPTTSETEAILAATSPFTCQSTSNFLRIEGFVPYNVQTSGQRFIVCVFRDSETDAYLTFPSLNSSNNNTQFVAFSCEIPVPDISAHTYTLSAGTSNDDFYINGDNTGRYYGGTMYCYLKVTEIKV